MNREPKERSWWLPESEGPTRRSPDPRRGKRLQNLGFILTLLWTFGAAGVMPALLTQQVRDLEAERDRYVAERALDRQTITALEQRLRAYEAAYPEPAALARGLEAQRVKIRPINPNRPPAGVPTLLDLPEQAGP